MTLKWRWAVLVGLVAGCQSDTSSVGPSTLVDPVDPMVAAAAALDAGAPKRALTALGEGRGTEPKAGLGLALRVMALIETNEWGRVERSISKLTGPELAAVTCMFAAARRDVTGDRLCRARGAEPASQTLIDGAIRAWARVAEDELRLAESELRLRELVGKRPTIANRKAFVAYLERNGFVAEAVTEVEAWKKAVPGDGSLDSKLVALLERKVRGDLLDKRAEAAESAARRVLELDPKRAAMRYFLADALDLKGDKAGAEAERAKAKAAGAEKPPAPDTFPGMVAPGKDGQPGQPGQKPPPGSGHQGHDHGHDHDH